MEQHYMEILLEEIRGKFDLVLEGHESLRSEIRELARRNDERFDLLDLKFEAVSHRIDAFEQRLDAKIDSVEQKLAARIDSVEQKLSKRIDNVELKLTNRIDSVEQNLSAHIDSVATDLAAHRHDTERHSGYRVSES